MNSSSKLINLYFVQATSQQYSSAEETSSEQESTKLEHASAALARANKAKVQTLKPRGKAEEKPTSKPGLAKGKKSKVPAGVEENGETNPEAAVTRKRGRKN